MLRIITDFDGPIVDVSERYYQVYQVCLAKTRRIDQSVHQLSKAEFWRLKRSRVPERQIAILSGLDGEQAAAFAALRRQIVHTVPYLDYDKLIPHAVDALLTAQKLGIDLVILTMRRFQEIETIFNCHDLGRFFPPDRCYCLSNDYVRTTDIEDKTLLMKQALVELPPASEVWMVGDTEADIIAAKTHQIEVAGVLCGIRDRASLAVYKPDRILADLKEAVDLIWQTSSFKRSSFASKREPNASSVRSAPDFSGENY